MLGAAADRAVIRDRALIVEQGIGEARLAVVCPSEIEVNARIERSIAFDGLLQQGLEERNGIGLSVAVEQRARSRQRVLDARAVPVAIRLLQRCRPERRRRHHDRGGDGEPEDSRRFHAAHSCYASRGTRRRTVRESKRVFKARGCRRYNRRRLIGP